jgi:trigger factor
VEAKKPEVPAKDLELALKDLQRMQTKETRATAGELAGAADKVVISVNMKKDGVGVEGGQSPNHSVYLGEEYYIPGFKEQLLGMKEGEEKTFKIPFPKEHPLKSLAGSDVDFEVALKEVYKLETPALDDAFAAKLGQKDVAALKARIEENMKAEREDEESDRQEREVLETIAKASIFDDIPDLLINEEIRKMTHELEHNVEQQGVQFDQYLKSIGKTLAQLKLDFTPQAITRIKIALVLRELAKREKVEIDGKELDAELDKLAANYDDAETKKRIYAPDYREYQESIMRNRKVLNMLKEAMVK